MAVISVAAAGLALRTALIGAEAAHLDSAALQESVERQRREQFLALVVDQDSRLFATYAQIDASRAGHEAELAGERDADNRAKLQLELKGEHVLLRAAGSMFQVVFPKRDAEGKLVFDASGTLAELLATDARLQELRSARSLARAEELNAVALTLIADVAILVAALLLLTVAQVARRRLLAGISAALGLAVAVGVIGLVAATDPSPLVRIVLMAALVVFIPVAIFIELIVLSGAGRRARAVTEGAGVNTAVAAVTTPDPAAGPAIEPPEDVLTAIDTLEEARSLTEPLPTPDPGVGDPRRLETPFARRVAVLIGTATLLAAVTGWLQASAFRNADIAAGNAQGHAIEATAATQRDVGAAEARIDRVTRHILATVSAANARQAGIWYADQEGQLAAAAAADREADRWDAIAATDPESAAIAASEFGPATYGPPIGGDARFPAQYLVQAQEAALIEVGLADADNKTSAAWSGQGSAYTGALAVLAVALYLLGLSLILPAQGIRRPFVAVAALAMLVVFGVGAVQVVLQPANPTVPSARDREAAERYAAGDIAMSRAQTDPYRRTELYELAARELEAAIDIRPDFALAHLDLSTVRIQLGTRQTSGFSTIIDADACDAATIALREAQRLGVTSAFAPWNLGYCAFRRGLAANDQAELARSETLLAEAVSILPSQGILRVNLGSVRLARGDIEGARRAYTEAVEPIKGANTVIGERELIIAAALGELDLIARRRADLAAEAQDLKRMLVTQTTPPSAAPDFALEDVEAYAFGGLIAWRATLPDGATAPEAATISQQWYRLDETTQEWYVVPEISGDVVLGSFQGLGFFADSTRPRGYYNQVTMPAFFLPPRCLDRGSYRLELYVGDTVATSTLELEDRPQVGELDRLLGVAFCRPEEWSEVDAERGHHLAFASEDGLRGIVALRAQVASVDAAGLPAFVEERLRGEAALFPGTPTPAVQGGVFNDSWYLPAAVVGGGGIVGYMSLDDGRLMNVKAGIDSTGSVVIVGVYGPAEDFAVEDEAGLYVANTLYVIN